MENTNAVNAEAQKHIDCESAVVDLNYINSNDYRRKFDKLTDNPKINRLIYQKAKEMLVHRNGTLFEDMYWIDYETGKIIAKVLDMDLKPYIADITENEQGIKYNKRTSGLIKSNKGLIAIHTHPRSSIPSDGDFRAFYLNEYKLGLILCHNGKIYKYSSNRLLNKDHSDMITYLIRKNMRKYSEKGIADEMALLEFSSTYNDFFFEEVK